MGNGHNKLQLEQRAHSELCAMSTGTAVMMQVQQFFNLWTPNIGTRTSTIS